MQFKITKSKLVEVLSLMNEVATKGLKAEFASAGRITMDAKSDRVCFMSTNGNTDIKFDVDANVDERLKVEQTGTATVDSAAIKNICQQFGGKDSSSHTFLMELTDENLKVRDLDAGKKSPNVKMQLFKENHEIKIKKEDGFKVTLPIDVLHRGISSVNKYASKMSYSEDVMFFMICVHFLPNEIRFVCGSGVFFAVNCILGQTYGNDIPAKGKRFIIPCDQAGILLSVLSGCSEAEFNFTSSKKIQVKNKEGLELEIKGLPIEEYVFDYEEHTFQESKAKVIADVKTSDLRDAMALVNACRDKEMESQTSFHSCKFNLAKDMLNMSVDEGKYRCDVHLDGKLYPLKEESYDDEYAAQFLSNVATANNNEYTRFYCVNQKGTIVAECLDLDNAKDENGVHVRQDSNSRLLFFFASSQMDDE